jgi:hypothetical protein
LEHLDSPPANAKDHSAFPDEYWEFFNPLDDDDDAVTIDSAQQYGQCASPAALPLAPTDRDHISPSRGERGI